MTDDTQQKAMKTIAEKIKQAEALIAEAEIIANENGVGFSWDGFAYGMGGSFIPRSDEDWSSSYEDKADENGVWRSSSSSC